MSNYPEIDPSDIRKGDLIRIENKSQHHQGDTAHEFCAGADADNCGWVKDQFVWYLLDRPTPAVVLPTEPTLGWASFAFHYEGEHGSGLPEIELGVWERRTFDNGNGVLRKSTLGRGVSQASEVTAFTEATAVPTSALDELRAVHLAIHNDVVMESSIRNRRRRHALDAFLEAIDEANGATR